MEKNFRVLVFGKIGCDKCKVLNQRLDTLMKKPEYQCFEKVYCDVETEEGLLHFCKSECINPQRIPAFIVVRKNDQGRFEPVPNPQPGAEDNVCKDARLYTYLGLQTDYSDEGRGIISPKMISAVLDQAISQ